MIPQKFQFFNYISGELFQVALIFWISPKFLQHTLASHAKSFTTSKLWQYVQFHKLYTKECEAITSPFPKLYTDLKMTLHLSYLSRIMCGRFIFIFIYNNDFNFETFTEIIYQLACLNLPGLGFFENLRAGVGGLGRG